MKRGSIRAIALTHRQIRFGWEMIMSQTIRSLSVHPEVPKGEYMKGVKDEGV
jgi:hypothetical protein